MAEYIERESALEAIWKPIVNPGGMIFDALKKACQEEVKQLPAADVAPVRRGKWESGKCSECGKHAPYWAMASTYYRSNFCPNCGAKMEDNHD